MGFLGLFSSWRGRTKKALTARLPEVHELYKMSLPVRRLVNGLRPHLPDARAQAAQLIAFYIGAIEGDVRAHMDVSKMSASDVCATALDVALYGAVEEGIVANDSELAATAQMYRSLYANAENGEFRKLGIGLTGAPGNDAEQQWALLLSKLKIEMDPAARDS